MQFVLFYLIVCSKCLNFKTGIILGKSVCVWVGGMGGSILWCCKYGRPSCENPSQWYPYLEEGIGRVRGLGGQMILRAMPAVACYR
jgi:hypothetical protein